MIPSRSSATNEKNTRIMQIQEITSQMYQYISNFLFCFDNLSQVISKLIKRSDLYVYDK